MNFWLLRVECRLVICTDTETRTQLHGFEIISKLEICVSVDLKYIYLLANPPFVFFADKLRRSFVGFRFPIEVVVAAAAV